MKTTILGDDHCPECKKKLDRASGLVGDEHVPGPGDITICIGCGTILKFAPDMALVIPSISDLNELSPNALRALLKVKHLIASDNENAKRKN